MEVWIVGHASLYVYWGFVWTHAHKISEYGVCLLLCCCHMILCHARPGAATSVNLSIWPEHLDSTYFTATHVLHCPGIPTNRKDTDQDK